MNSLSQLSAQDVWSIFAGICRIPHPSGSEKALSLHLKQLAEKHRCTAHFDDYGNLRIDRKNGDPDKAIILQGHMDMVPACVDGKKFDFAREAIVPVVKGERVVADGTTLGGDDGMGVALALALLFAPELQKIQLAALFTRQEEVGMLGAAALPPEFLRGKLLINLDSGCDDVFQIGCAGGVRTHLAFCPGWKKAAKGQGAEITLGNLAGGHSGVDIHLNHANALILLAKILKDQPLELADFRGGNADNAIPAQASCRVVSELPLEKLKSLLQSRADLLRNDLTSCDQDFSLQIKSAGEVKEVFAGNFSAEFLAKLADAPDGPLTFSKRYKSVHTSSNIGMAIPREKGFDLISSQRSFVDAKRDQAARRLVRHFGKLAAKAEHQQPYPGWKPERNAFQRIAAATWRKLYGKEPRFEVIHAGLECGIIRGKAPKLPIIATFPLHGNLHTPSEYLDIASVGRVRDFLAAFLLRAGVEK